MVGFLCLLGAVAFVFTLASYSPSDPSWNTAVSSPAAVHPLNKTGRVGAVLTDFLYQSFGLAAWLFPFIAFFVGWRWMRNRTVEAPLAKSFGYVTLASSLAALCQLWIPWKPYQGAFEIGGITGFLLNALLVDLLNPWGTAFALIAMAVVSLYLISTFSLARITESAESRLVRWNDERRERRAAAEDEEVDRLVEEPSPRRARRAAAAAAGGAYDTVLPIADEVAQMEARALMAQENGNGHSYPETPAPVVAEAPPWEEDIPIHTLEETPPPPPPAAEKKRKPERSSTDFRLPPTDLLNEPAERESYDRDELKVIAASIKAKLEEFNVLGNVVQINPGPVVTTYEFKPDAGVKIARITTLCEDLALGLQAESVLIERIPGKPTVAIELPNSRRETIALRQMLESVEFSEAAARLTIALGKDISGRIRITELEKMPHLLIAGTTGSGKSVMLNALILSILYRSTPEDVRLILVDPKRVELGIYDGIPHLLTPVIADAKKATNALRNAVLEMERRLKLLASYGVRNIDQFNKRLKQKQEKPMSLFPGVDDAPAEPEEQPLPLIVIVIDELADLMMLERAGVEESIIRLAQMARAVGIHLVLATQRPSVDVITGLIKANLPARISFKLRTRIDSRTVLDVMGAENLLGMGDMLFLPPGSSRLLRVHGPFVTEAEINRVCDFWREQATPEYDASYLSAPPSDDDEPGEEEFDGEQDPLYVDAVKVVLEMGKASTSILQRRLRLGYGRAARILDMMQHEGIIGPPDGSRPREVLRRPDWFDTDFRVQTPQ